MTPRRRWIHVVIAIALVGAVAYQAQNVKRIESRPYGRLTADQVLSKSESIVHSIDSNAPPFKLSALHGPADAALHTWQVDCKAADGRDIAHITWDADTGELHSLGHLGRPRKIPEGPVLNRKEAVRSAWNWLKATGVSKLSRVWHVDRAVQKNGAWCVRMKSENRTAFVTIGYKTSDLNWLLTWSFRPNEAHDRSAGAAAVQADPNRGLTAAKNQFSDNRSVIRSPVVAGIASSRDPTPANQDVIDTHERMAGRRIMPIGIPIPETAGSKRVGESEAGKLAAGERLKGSVEIPRDNRRLDFLFQVSPN